VGGAIRARPLHRTDGYPKFRGWPEWDTGNHQQMYVDALHRAYRGGLRLMVMLAVNNEALCRKLAKPAPGRTCDDMEAIDVQIEAAKRLEAHVDALHNGRGWYRIVYSPAEARAALRANQLAVVLGAEVDRLFGCRVDGVCDEASVRAALDAYHARGLRHVVPVHLANNAFGGYALYGDWFDYNNWILTGAFPRPAACDDPDITYRLSRAPWWGRLILRLVGFPGAPKYPEGSHCNPEGLTPLGRTLVRELMARGMVIDIDHLSRASTRDLLAITTPAAYPVVSSHTGFVAVGRARGRHEGQKTADQLAAIAESGGMVSAILNQGLRGEVGQWEGSSAEPNAVVNDCERSSKSWAQAYQYAVATLGVDRAAVGLGSDQALNPWLGPRFGDDGCDGMGQARKRQANPVTYPFPAFDGGHPLGRSRLGLREFDFNEDGFAHIGLLPDFVEDLRNIGVTERQLEPLFRSAWGYVEAWQRATDAAVEPAEPDDQRRLRPGTGHVTPGNGVTTDLPEVGRGGCLKRKSTPSAR
jgi:microsomal dipeptidase-like Zn-dependent dipeptidase